MFLDLLKTSCDPNNMESGQARVRPRKPATVGITDSSPKNQDPSLQPNSHRPLGPDCLGFTQFLLASRTLGETSPTEGFKIV